MNEGEHLSTPIKRVSALTDTLSEGWLKTKLVHLLCTHRCWNATFFQSPVRKCLSDQCLVLVVPGRGIEPRTRDFQSLLYRLSYPGNGRIKPYSRRTVKRFSVKSADCCLLQQPPEPMVKPAQPRCGEFLATHADNRADIP